MQTLKFIQAKQSDKAYLSALRRCTMKEHFYNAGQELSDQEHEARLTDLYECMHIVFYADKKVGAIKYQELDDWFEVMQLQIHPDYQGNGIGNMVMQRVLDIAGSKPVRLTVLKSNPAKKLYQRLGFVVTGEDDYEHHMQTKS